MQLKYLKSKLVNGLLLYATILLVIILSVILTIPKIKLWQVKSLLHGRIGCINQKDSVVKIFATYNNPRFMALKAFVFVAAAARQNIGSQENSLLFLICHLYPAPQKFLVYCAKELTDSL